MRVLYVHVWSRHTRSTARELLYTNIHKEVMALSIFFYWTQHLQMPSLCTNMLAVLVA